MNYHDHDSIAKAIKDATESFAPADRIAYTAAFLNVANFLATMLNANNPDEFRREKFMHNCGIKTTWDQRERMRSNIP